MTNLFLLFILNPKYHKTTNKMLVKLSKITIKRRFMQDIIWIRP